MYTKPKETRLSAKPLLAGIVVGLAVSGSAALAAPVTDNTPMYDMYESDAETATTAPVAPQTTAQQAPSVTNPGDIRYMSGGIGADEQALFAVAQSEYPVKLVFADSHGAYMSDVEVTVMDKSGATVLALQTEGPILLMDLQPGNYAVQAKNKDNGQVKTQNIYVSDKTNKSYTLHFKATGQQDYGMKTVE